jgi:hypothetical protein
MLSPTGAAVLISFVILFGLSAVALSIVLLNRGKLYRRLSPEQRPRRWVLFSLLVLFGVFALWFPTWMAWPNAFISRVLFTLFILTFSVVTIGFKWFSPLIDKYIQRKRWRLR